MSYTVPYSFTPGTKARAQEVNANFNALTDYFDTLDSAKADVNLSNLSSQAIDVIKNNSSIRNIGEIIVSPLPLDDSGLHLLDGSLINNEGIYKEFVNFIKNLYNDDSTANYFTSESSWQSSVTTYGACGKFVYDSVNNTVRLPKITGIIEGTASVSTLGNLVTAGLPNITGNSLGFPHWNNGSQFAAETSSGAFSKVFTPSGSATAISTNVASASYNTYVDYNSFDASRSSAIYGRSSTVQPQTVKCFYYIVIATTAKTDIQIDIDEIATDLNGKADTDLSNTSNKLADTFLNKITPDYSNGITMGLPTYPLIDSSTTFTAPSAGFCDISAVRTAAGYSLTIYVNGINVGELQAYNAFGCAIIIPVNKGDVVLTITNSTSATWEICTQKFYPLKGAN